jgi:RAB protein geranylgeranyltransferase component A
MSEIDDIQLDTDTYDVIILGTGLAEAILAGYANDFQCFHCI